MNRAISAIVAVIAALFGLIAAPGLAPTASAAAAHGYAYDDAHRHADARIHTTTERGPPAAYDRVTNYGAAGRWSRGASTCPGGPTTPAICTYDDSALLAQFASVAATAQETAQGSVGPPASFQRSSVAAETEGVFVQGSEAGTRTINFRPNATDPNWGLTSKHLNKHLLGDGSLSLRSIDPGGNTDLWFSYLQDLAARPATATLKNGVQDVIGTFPRTGGSGTFQFGIRIAPGQNGTWDLVTLLTKQ